MTGVKKRDPPLRRDKVSSPGRRDEREGAPRYRARVPRGRRACHVRAVRMRAESAARRFRAGLVNVVTTDLSIAAVQRRSFLSPGENERRSKKPPGLEKTRLDCFTQKILRGKKFS